MAEISIARSDEPFDFRHQAARYSVYRRDYSAALYAAIEERVGAGVGRGAMDLGCGTGFVTMSLARRKWEVVGVDFSAPMLAEARAVGQAKLRLVRARAEALPLQDGSVTLVTCGTAFHWLQPAPTLAELTRVLEPGGWVALFWRYPTPDQPYLRLVGDVLARVVPGAVSPRHWEGLHVHSPEPFAFSNLVPDPPRIIESTLDYTAESFHGYIGTTEWLRRLAGAYHADFLATLREELELRYPDGIHERNQEFLFLAHR
jgi:SAM-dependent methyltransferase